MNNQVIFDAKKYAHFRPSYPNDLFKTIYQHVDQFSTVWDCACGTGQAAIILAKHFKHVIATDISDTQIKQATQDHNIRYLVEPAENTTIEKSSIDLIVIAQALHWLDAHTFAVEVNRVLKVNGTFAAWTYALPRVNPKVDQLIDYLANVVLKEYWPEGREHIDNGYQHIACPVPISLRKEFTSERKITLDDLLGYLQSWSPRANYLAKHGEDIIEKMRPEFCAVWGELEKQHTIRWPIQLLLGNKN